LGIDPAGASLDAVPAHKLGEAGRALRDACRRHNNAILEGHHFQPTEKHTRIPIARPPQRFNVPQLRSYENWSIATVYVMPVDSLRVLWLCDNHRRAIEPQTLGGYGQWRPHEAEIVEEHHFCCLWESRKRGDIAQPATAHVEPPIRQRTPPNKQINYKTRKKPKHQKQQQNKQT